MTHWPELTRLVRAEVLQVKNTQYVKAAEKMGHSKFMVAKDHIIPHVMPVYLTGLVLLFPHAIMHEASLTFLGFGFSASTPAIGEHTVGSDEAHRYGKVVAVSVPGADPADSGDAF